MVISQQIKKKLEYFSRVDEIGNGIHKNPADFSKSPAKKNY